MFGARIVTSGSDNTIGASKMTRSKARVTCAVKACMRRVLNRSTGFDGIKPGGSIFKFSRSVSRKPWCQSVPCTKMSVSPLSCVNPKLRCSAGRRKSTSTRRTRHPSWANETPRLAAVVDFPSLGAALVINSDFNGCGVGDCSEERTVRYASATLEPEACRVIGFLRRWLLR